MISGNFISDLVARQICQAWNGYPAIDRMEETGEINDSQKTILLHLLFEQDGDNEPVHEAYERGQLMDLLDYVVAYGPRGPVNGWRAA